MKCARGIACESVLARSCRHLWAPRPCPAGQVVRLSETGVAFARSYVRGVETVIAFAGEKRAILVRFSVAEVTVVSTGAVQGRAVVLLVSMGAVQGCAVVMGVSCWSASVAAEVSLVSKSPRGCVLCARRFALLGLMVGECVNRFTQRTREGLKSAFCGVLGEFFLRKHRSRGCAGRTLSRASSRGIPPGNSCPASGHLPAAHQLSESPGSQPLPRAEGRHRHCGDGRGKADEALRISVPAALDRPHESPMESVARPQR